LVLDRAITAVMDPIINQSPALVDFWAACER
jgi:hypothetical protein